MNDVTPTQEDALQTLRQVIDPELGINIVDLGLVYGVDIEGANVTVRMTLTTPGCPMGETLARGVEVALLSRGDIEKVEVQLVWDPPWTPSRIAPAAG